MPAPACYREFAPSPAMRGHVRAFFTYSMPTEPAGTGRLITRRVLFRDGERAVAPLFADGHISIVFSFGSAYSVRGLWEPGGPSGHVIGAMSQARLTSHGDSIIQVGAYLRAAKARDLTWVPAYELTDRIVALEDLWTPDARALEARLYDAASDCERVSILEQALCKRIRPRVLLRLDVAGLADHVLAQAGMPTVEQLADAAGVSRQHLARVFREETGVTPKLYCRLARFRAALSRVPTQSGDWAAVAAELGYADQSHLIADFKQFSGLTPAAMAAERRFHPFAA